MTRETIAAALESEGLKSGSKGYAVPDERDLTVFISAPGDVLNVGRVSRLEARDAVLILETAKGERFFFAYEDVLGMKFSQGASAKDRAPGFSR